MMQMYDQIVSDINPEKACMIKTCMVLLNANDVTLTINWEFVGCYYYSRVGIFGKWLNCFIEQVTFLYVMRSRCNCLWNLTEKSKYLTDQPYIVQ